jgi:hypothetical protein
MKLSKKGSEMLKSQTRVLTKIKGVKLIGYDLHRYAPELSEIVFTYKGKAFRRKVKNAYEIFAH